MYSFIPSWYGDRGEWQGSILPWHEAGCSYEFDDTVNHLRMFRDAGEETEILCLGWSPRLRRFLHRQSLERIACWSVFDELQGITLQKPAVFSYLELPWPENVEWVYMPTHLAAYCGNQHYADVEFAGDGTLCWVDYYADGYPARRDIYDDRGFCSSSVFYQRGKLLRQEYYDQDGRLRFTWEHGSGEDGPNLVIAKCHAVEKTGAYETAANEAVVNGTGFIQIAKDAEADFAKSVYSSMEELIGERLIRYLSASPDREAIVIAANTRHDSLVRGALESLPKQRIVMSFFEDRFDLQDEKAVLEDTQNASLIVTDTEHAARQIREAGVQDIPICDISPFDVRLPLGKSQQIRELKIFMPLDGLEGVLLEKALQQLFAYMRTNQDAVLLAGTRASTYSEQERLQEKLNEVLLSMSEPGLQGISLSERQAQDPGIPPSKQQAQGAVDSSLEQYAPRMDVPPATEQTREQEGGGGGEIAARIRVTPYHSETDLIRILRDARLILDVRDQPELYLQIAGISAGIPQVNYRFTRYVKHKKDGYIIQNINYITGALEYYLDSLSGWNEALVYCVQEVSEYTGGTLVQRWKRMLDEAAQG